MVATSRRQMSALLLAFALVISLLPPIGGIQAVHADGSPLTDIANSYAKQEIQALVDSGIISGYMDGSFRPRQPMTRAELAKIISLAMGLGEDPKAAEVYADVKSGSWYAGYVGALAQAGIVQGRSATAFAPHAHITREELVVFFIRAFGLEDMADELALNSVFRDFGQVSAWAKPHVSLAYQIGFVNGMKAADGSLLFQPKQLAERQALARLAYEFYKNHANYLEKAQQLLDASQAEAAEEEEEEEDQETAPVPFVPGGGGGSGGSDDVPFNQAGTYNGDYTIRTSGTFGPVEGTAIVSGKITLDPGSNGEVRLRNLTAATIEVRSGASQSIQMDNVTAETLSVNASSQSNSVRIQLSAGTVITRTEVGSKVILDSAEGTAGEIEIQPSAADQTVELRGTFAGNVHVAQGADGVVLELAEGAQLDQLQFEASGSLHLGDGAKIHSVSIERPVQIEVAGQGEIDRITVSPSAAGSTLKLDGSAAVGTIRIEANVKLEGDPESIGEWNIEAAEGVVIEADDALKARWKDAVIAQAIQAIAAIGTISEYSEAKEAEVQSARGKVNAAKALGANDADITNLTVLQAAEKAIAELKDALPGGEDPVAHPSIGLEYLGHSAFILTTEKRKILMDPWAPLSGLLFGLPMYTLADESELDLATVSHFHSDHYGVAAVAPTIDRAKQILTGIDRDDFTKVKTITNSVYGDVTISTVSLPHFELNSEYRDAEPNAGFIFETAGMRIVHMGDAFGPIIDGLTEQERNALKGEAGIDILMMPIGDAFGGALDHKQLLQVIEDLNPRVVVPIHRWNHLQPFLDAVKDAGYAVTPTASNVSMNQADLSAAGTVIWNMAPSVVHLNNIEVEDVTKTSATLSFTIPDGAVSVSMEQALDIEWTWSEVTTQESLTTESTTVTVTGLTPEQTYKFRLLVRMGGSEQAVSISPFVYVTTTPPDDEDEGEDGNDDGDGDGNGDGDDDSGEGDGGDGDGDNSGGDPTPGPGKTAPLIEGYTILPGWEAGAVFIDYISGDGNQLFYLLQSASFGTAPLAGDDLPEDASVFSLEIVDVQAGDHIRLYEVDESNKVVKYVDIELMPDHIAQAAPFIEDYVLQAGSMPGTVKILYIADPGNLLKLVKKDWLGIFRPSFPLLGGKHYDPDEDYTSGDDISIIAGESEYRYLRLYEVDGDGNIVRYVQIDLAAESY